MLSSEVIIMMYLIFLLIGALAGAILSLFLVYKSKTHLKAMDQHIAKIEEEREALKKALDQLKEEAEDVKETKAYHNINDALRKFDDTISKLRK